MFKPPLPHDEAAETASFRKAFASAMQKADPVCSPAAAKTESIQGLAALVDSGQAGSILFSPSGYAAFYENKELWVRQFRRLNLAIAEVLLLQSTHRLSTECWVECDTALRDKLRGCVKEATEYGLLLFLTDASA